jgi:hypothetical protein
MSEAEIAGSLAMTVLGGRVWPTELEGVVCPAAHHGRGPKPRCSSGVGCHWEQCSAETNHQRHSALKNALGALLKAHGRVEYEKAPGERGGLVNRSYAPEDKDKMFPGDVVLTTRTGRVIFFDTTVSSVAGKSAVTSAKPAAVAAYEAKMKAWETKIAHHSKAAFVPVAMSTSSCVAPLTQSRLSEWVSLDDLHNLVAETMITQMLITRKLARRARMAGPAAPIDVNSDNDSDDGDSDDSDSSDRQSQRAASDDNESGNSSSESSDDGPAPAGVRRGRRDPSRGGGRAAAARGRAGRGGGRGR